MDAYWQQPETQYYDQRPKVPQPYSVARQRAQQQIRSARGCRDIELKHQRLAAALDAAAIVGLPDPVIFDAREELCYAQGAAEAREVRAPTPEPPSSQLPAMRPVTPVALRSLNNVQFSLNQVAFLHLRDDGVAELLDAVDPSLQATHFCRVFDEGSLPTGQVHAVIQDYDRPAVPQVNFSHQALWELITFCAPFRAVIAVVDVLRPGGQLLCSQLLNRGPQGPLVGVIAACPGLDTPPSLAGPAYGALSACLCLGSQKLGLGGVGWAGGGVFGRCLAIADRAVACDGGWPSPRLSQLAFNLVAVAELAQGPGGMDGPFLFGCEPDSAEECARSETIYAWLQGASQCCHTTRAWVSYFTECGIFESEHNEGPLWLDASVRLGRWPHMKGYGAEVHEGQQEEAEEDEAEVDAEVAAATKAPQAKAEAKVKGPFAGVQPSELPLAPPLRGPLPSESKVAVPFGAEAAALLSDLASQQSAGNSFTLLPVEALPTSLPDGVLQKAEVIFVVDFADPSVVSWPVEIWPQWTAAVKAVGGVLMAAVLLPGADAPDHHWYSALVALNSLIEDFSFAVFLQASDFARARLALSGLLDRAVPLKQMVAHLSPLDRLHFAIAYAGMDFRDMATRALDVACCVAPIPSDLECPSAETRQGLLEQFGRVGLDTAAVKQAKNGIAQLLQELASQCGGVLQEDVAQIADESVPVMGIEAGDEAGEAVAEDATPPDAAPAETPAEPQVEGAGEAEPAAFDVGDAQGQFEGGLAQPAEDGGGDVMVSQSATLLSFVIGSCNAAAEMEETLKAHGEQLEDGPNGPSLVYPAFSYGFGCVPPKPWGVSWASERPEAVALVVHSRMIISICSRILFGVDDAAFKISRGEVAAFAPPGGEEQTFAPDEEATFEPPAAEEIDAVEMAALKIQQAVRRRSSNRKAQAEAEP